MDYCEYCGNEVPDNVLLCNCQQGLTAYIGRLAGHLHYRANLGFWHEGALTDLIIIPLIMLFILIIFIAMI